MSKHTIHGAEVEINVYQGNLTEQARGRCIGKVVNICREMPANEFLSGLRAPMHSRQLADFCGRVDDALNAPYESGLIASLTEVAHG